MLSWIFRIFNDVLIIIVPKWMKTSVENMSTTLRGSIVKWRSFQKFFIGQLKTMKPKKFDYLRDSSEKGEAICLIQSINDHACRIFYMVELKTFLWLQISSNSNSWVIPTIPVIFYIFSPQILVSNHGPDNIVLIFAVIILLYLIWGNQLNVIDSGSFLNKWFLLSLYNTSFIWE